MGETTLVETNGRGKDFVSEKEMENHSDQTVKVTGNRQGDGNHTSILLHNILSRVEKVIALTDHKGYMSVQLNKLEKQGWVNI